MSAAIRRDVQQDTTLPLVEHTVHDGIASVQPTGCGFETTLASMDTTANLSQIPIVPAPWVHELANRLAREQVFEALFDASQESVALGRFEIRGTLGRGGMGTVLRAFDATLSRMVAIKILHKELDALHTARLRREAQALAKLSHPNVVQVYEVGEVDSQTFVAMELIKGRTLKEWVKNHPRPRWRACIEVYLQVGAGLAAAHERGLVHRDFKPSNAIIDRKGRVRVLDFGLACRSEGAEELESHSTRFRQRERGRVSLEQSLTHTGTVLGTPAYMSPEQMRGDEVDARSDQFSFCVALYEAIYGHRPYEGSTMAALSVSMAKGQVRVAPWNARVPSRLRRILLRGLAADPRRRWPSMEVLLCELRRLISARRCPWLPMMMASTLTCLGTLAIRSMTQEPVHEAAPLLDEIWDEDARQDVERGIRASGIPNAASTWRRVQRNLDSYAWRWTSRHNTAYRAVGGHRPEAVAELWCLKVRREEFEDVIDALSDGDLTSVKIAGFGQLLDVDGIDQCRGRNTEAHRRSTTDSGTTGPVWDAALLGWGI